MNFNIKLENLTTPALSLQYYKVPWDTELMSRNSAQLQKIEIYYPVSASIDFQQFISWMEGEKIAFTTAKIAHRDCAESRLVQEFGFRFIELNFRPYLNLTNFDFSVTEGLAFLDADKSDRDLLCEYAASIFTSTRFHLDPLLGAKIGNRRYQTWMKNAFDLPHQRVLKCMKDSKLIAFFVLERPEASTAFWSLVGLSPGFQGKGLGKTIWTAALHWLRKQGYEQIETSISSLNLPVMNLYVQLGFKFPEPLSVFHRHNSSKYD